MDTGTHFVVGLGLAGLAHVDPAVSQDPQLATAILIGTVLGSQIPDIDTVLKFKSNKTYVRNHRGWSHSIPAIIGWTLSLTLLIQFFFSDVSIVRLALWIGIAVCVHVFSDLFNTYGTQALRPFSKKWISWNIIHIFDPIIFISHSFAITLWAFNVFKPEILFPTLYTSLILYYIWRTFVHFSIKRKLPALDQDHDQNDRYTLIPTVHLQHWHVLKRKENGEYFLGEWRQQSLTWNERIRREHHPAVEISKQEADVKAFLELSNYACPTVKHHSWGYEVRWIDMRYWHRKNYPFVAVVTMDRNYNILNSYVGWLSESKLERRLFVEQR